MKPLSHDMKRMLNTLAYRHAGEYATADKGAVAAGAVRARRVALLSDGESIDRVLQFAIEASQRQQASLDLVLYGQARQLFAEMRQELKRRQVEHEVILLGDVSMDSLVEYLTLRRGLFYLIAPSDDVLAQAFTETVLPSHGSRLFLPVVLVDRKRQLPPHQVSRINLS